MAIKMTPELRAKLAGLLPMNADAYVEYTPQAFEGIEELQPVFKIKQFNNEQVNKIKQIMMRETTSKKKSNKDVENINKEYYDLLHKVIVGWEDYVELSTGEDFVYDGKLETLLKLPEWLLIELYAEAIRITGFLPHGTI